MYFNILTNNNDLYKKISRRNFLFLLALLPLINAFKYGNKNFNEELKSIIGHKGTILIADISSGQIIECTNINRAIKGYTIGSLAKLITSTALLEERIISKEEIYNCKGHEIINKKRISCWKPYGHGVVNLENAISQSCNLFFYKFGSKISSEDLLKYYKIFKLNNSMLLPDQIKLSNSLPEVSKNSDIALGIDQKLLISPINMLSLACTLAKNGIYKPLWFKNKVDKEYNLPISKSTLSIVRNGMIRCSTEGTTKILHQNGFDVAAKTGTAPYNTKDTHGWCIGFTPVNKPVLAFCVFVDNGTGFSDATRLTNKLLKLCKEFHYI